MLATLANQIRVLQRAQYGSHTTDLVRLFPLDGQTVLIALDVLRNRRRQLQLTDAVGDVSAQISHFA